MPRLRDSRGRFTKDIVEQPSSLSSNSETESSEKPSESQTMENIGNPPNNDPPHDNPLYANRSMHEYINPTRTSTPSCIEFPPNTPYQGFKPEMIQLLPTFHGLENENPYVHIREFEEVVATFRGQTQTLDIVRLRLFPFSLKDKVKVWLYSLRPKFITTWDDMIKAFFHKYYSNHKTQNIKKQISTFA